MRILHCTNCETTVLLNKVAFNWLPNGLRSDIGLLDECRFCGLRHCMVERDQIEFDHQQWDLVVNEGPGWEQIIDDKTGEVSIRRTTDF